MAQLDPLEKCLRDETGEEDSYGKLLLAMGGSPIRLPFGGDDIIYDRDLLDYHHLRSLSENGVKFLVIGGRFIGSESAAALTRVGKKVTMIFPDEAVGEISSKLEMVTDWQGPLQKGVIYYLEKGRVRGVLLWNVWDQVNTARALIAEPGPYTSTDLIGRFFS